MKLPFAKPEPETSSKFSEFIREASSAQKKRVYSKVLKEATDRQLETVRNNHAEAP